MEPGLYRNKVGAMLRVSQPAAAHPFFYGMTAQLRVLDGGIWIAQSDDELAPSVTYLVTDEALTACGYTLVIDGECVE